MRFSLVTALITAGFGTVAGHVQDAVMYPLKQRQDQATRTKRFNLTDLPYYEVSYSEDSSPKLLSRFIIALFETDGQLPFYPSLFNVEMAVQDFVEAELNSAYAPFSRIKNVHAKVISQINTASTRSMRSLQMRGSELEMELNVTFANEPSPEISDVDLALKMAMENMTYFLTNLTKRAEGDQELENVHSAFRLEISDPNQIQAPPEEIGGEEPGSSPSTGSKFIIPLVCAFCAATLFVGFLAVRRQRVSRSRDGRGHEFTGYDDGLNWDNESDIFSYETALLEDPHEKAPPVKAWLSGGSGMSNNVGFDDEDLGDNRTRFVSNGENSYQFSDVALGSPNRESTVKPSSELDYRYDSNDLFSAANSDYPPQRDSPLTKKGPRSVFGVFSSRASSPSKSEQSANTRSGVSELQMVGHAALAAELGPAEEILTPGSYTSSVFTFSDEDEGQRGRDSNDEVMEIVNDIESGYRSNWQVQSAKDESEGHYGASLQSYAAESENLPKKEDLSLSGELLGLSVTGIPSEDEVASPKSVHSQPFDEESPRRDQIQYHAESRSIDNSSSSLFGPDGYPLSQSKALPVHLHQKSLSDSKIQRKKDHITLSPKSHSETKPKSLNGPHADSLTWGSVDSTGIKKNLSKNGSGYYDWGITLRPVKSPTQSKEELSEPSGGANGSQKYLDDRELKSFDALWESEELNSVHKIGRRHTKSTVADGTTNYQSEAMDPQDWSVSTGEDGSCASTEVADTTPQKSGKKKRNFLSSFFSSSKKKGVDSFQAAEVSNIAEQSPASSATDDEFAEVEAETHKQQLISDLVWLENKFTSGKGTQVSSPGEVERHRQLGDKSRKPLDSSRSDSFLEDSLSFRSGDQSRSYYGSSLDTTTDFMSPGAEKDLALKGLQTILCRDCFAPPGKLKIVIHSTKDGPAIHTVKPGSALLGHIFPGDLIISVDDVDTRSCTAEQVMKMMTERARYERKITVLHFEKTEEL